MAKIGKILVRIEVHDHEYTETAKEKYLFIGTLYGPGNYSGCL
jgi:hypothetical protein